jgi:hypothetical protein
MSERVGRVKRELGFTDRPWEEIRRKTAPCAQMSLALAGSNSPAETTTLWAVG